VDTPTLWHNDQAEFEKRAVSVEEIGIAFHDFIPQALKLEPPKGRGACGGGQFAGHFVGPELGSAGGFGQELGVTALLHTHEPPRGFVDGAPAGEEAVSCVDGHRLVPEPGS